LAPSLLAADLGVIDGNPVEPVKPDANFWYAIAVGDEILAKVTTADGYGSNVRLMADAKLNAAKVMVAERLFKQLELASEALNLDVLNDAGVEDIRADLGAWRELTA
jgi:hypothetical protein